jgi:hypothetical protein
MSTPQPRQQLLLVKNLYTEAIQASGRDDKFSTSKGILFFDLAVEQMLLTVVTSLPTKGPVPTGELKWDKLWQAASDIMAENGHTLPGNAALRSLHQDRNRVQHSGSTFHFSQVRKYVGHVGNMLAVVFQDAFGLNFETFREWDLVGSEDLRRWLKESEDFLSEGNVVACIVGCALAHSWIMSAIRKETKQGRMRGSIGREVRDRAVLRAFKDMYEALAEDISQLENEVVAIGVGLPVMDTRRFLRYTRLIGIFEAEAGNLQLVHRGKSEENDPDVANYMLDYVARLIQFVEDSYPSVLDMIKVKIFLKDQEVWQKRGV